MSPGTLLPPLPETFLASGAPWLFQPWREALCLLQPPLMFTWQFNACWATEFLFGVIGTDHYVQDQVLFNSLSHISSGSSSAKI